MATESDPSNIRGNYRSMDELRRANAAAGLHWFDPGALRFFRSRVSTTLYAGCVFVTSERNPSGRRAYSVRVAHADASIQTVGAFMSYASRNGAHAAAARIARAAQARGQHACPCARHAEPA